MFSAATVRPVPSGSPVFGLTSKRGKLLLEMSSRMRWPFLKTLLVGNRVIVERVDSPGSSGSVRAVVAVAGADDAVVEVQGVAVGVVGVRRVDIDQLRGEIGVDGRGRCPEPDLIGPVTSVSASRGAVWKVTMSRRAARGSVLPPKSSGRPRWSKPPAGITFSAAEMLPPIVGTGSHGS